MLVALIQICDFDNGVLMGKEGHQQDNKKSGPPAWDLRALFPGPESPVLDKAFTGLHADALDFSGKYKEKVGKLSGRELAEAIGRYEKISEQADTISAYADLLEASDNDQAKAAAALRDRLRKSTGELLFFPLEINKIKEADLLDKIAAPGLAQHAPWLREVRSFREHQLEDDVERYLHDKKPVAEDAWHRLYDMTMADLRFNVRGKQLTEAETLHILDASNDGALRREAFIEFTRVLGENKSTFALIANTLADLKKVSDKAREFEKPEDSRHLSNQIDGEAVMALVKAVKESYPRTSHRYYAWKAKQFGQARLHPADRNAPLPGSAVADIPWEEAKQTVLGAYARLSPEMAEIGRRFFETNKIDAAPRPGKDGGAFSHPVTPSAHPFILMNYFGAPGDVMTLAHELGHGIHQVLAAGQGHLKSQTPLTLAETASIFGEMLAFRALLDGEEDLFKKRSLLAGKIEDMLNTVARQTAFFCFEQKVHDERAKKGELAAERIAQLWQETQKESLGPAVNLDVTGAENLWTVIPHFIHTPFYVYAYAFGDCLVNALFDAYDKTADKKDFTEKYIDLLKAGGSKRLAAALEPFGLDASDPQFWKKGLSLIERYLDELEAVDRKIDSVLKSKDEFKAAANDVVTPPDAPADKNVLPKGPKGGVG